MFIQTESNTIVKYNNQNMDFEYIVNYCANYKYIKTLMG